MFKLLAELDWPSLLGTPSMPKNTPPGGRSVEALGVSELRGWVLANIRGAGLISAGFADPALRDRIREVGNFGFCLRGFLLYAQCAEPGLRQEGILIRDDGAAFALGLYERAGRVVAHIVSPQGPNWPAAVKRLSAQLFDRGVAAVYLRHLTPAQADRLSAEDALDPLRHAGSAWCPEAPYEDETYNHRVLVLADLLDPETDSPVSLEAGPEPTSKNFRRKFRMSYNRFENFLERNGLRFEMVPMVAPMPAETTRLVSSHFEYLRESNKAIGSVEQDFRPMLDHFAPHGGPYCSLIGVLSRGGRECPVALFLGEELKPGHGGLHCTITNRDIGPATAALGELDETGFSAISQYAHARAFRAAAALGWKTVDLGGSETANLDRFKRELGALESPTVWRRLVPGA